MKDLAPNTQFPLAKTLVLGLGNPILTDDGVGIHIVRAAAAQCSPRDGVTFAEASVGGLRLLDLLAGYDRAILVDAIQTHGGQPGEFYWLGLSDLCPSLHSGSTHDLSLPSALDLGRRLGMKLPGNRNLAILAVEVEDLLTIGETCTPAVAQAISHAAEATLAELKKHS